MKLQKLVVENFIAYRERQEIPWADLLGEHRLLLITGPTGSGKSTLMDGILYALFGAYRTRKSSVRPPVSQYAPENPARVMLEFQVGSERFRIHREWQRTAEGWRQTRQEWETWQGGSWEPVEPATVQSRFPLLRDYEVFRRVVVIPQGEYAHFITARPADRYHLLQRLLPLDWVDRLREVIQELCKSGEEERTRVRAQIWSLLQALPSLPETTETIEDPLDFAPLMKEGETALTQEAEALARQEKEVERLEQDLKAKRERHQRVREEAGRVEELRGAVETMVRLMEEKPAIERLQREVERLDEFVQALQGPYERLRSHEKRLQEIQKERQRKSEALTREEEAWQRILPEVEKLEEYREELEVRIRDLERKQERVRQLEKLIDLMKEREKLRERLHRADQFLKDFRWVHRMVLENRVRRIQRTYQRLKNDVKDLEKRWRDLEGSLQEAHLASLAASLREGEPCPLCGSPHHPRPFKPGDAVRPLEELLKERRRLEQRIQKKREEMEKLSREMERLQARMEGLPEEGRPYGVIREAWNLPDTPEEAVEAWEDRGVKEPDIEKKRESILRALHEVEGSIKEMLEEGLEDRLPAVEEALQRTRRDVAGMEKKVGELKRNIRHLEKEEKARKEKIHKLRAAVETLDREIAREQKARDEEVRRLNEALAASRHHTTMDDVQRSAREVGQRQSLLKKLDAWRNALNRARTLRDRVLTHLGSQVDASRKSLLLRAREEDGEVLTGVLREIRVWESRLREEQRTLEKTIEAMEQQHRDQMEAIARRRESIEKSRRALEEARVRMEAWKPRSRRLDMLRRLQDHLGETEFRYWVATRFVRGMLREASRYLEAFSQGRYTFVWEHEARGNSLPIEVKDHQTGAIREARHLSGGEKFMVSLALALGMAHLMVQSRGSDAPGFLFLDEGFGTLDRDTLTRVAQILRRHAQEQDVDLLVISHRSELRDYFPVHLEVVPSPEGSHIQIRVGA